MALTNKGFFGELYEYDAPTQDFIICVRHEDTKFYLKGNGPLNWQTTYTITIHNNIITLYENPWRFREGEQYELKELWEEPI